MLFQAKRKFEEISKYPFFEAVGEALPGSVTRVNNWPAAAKMCRSQKWETCRLMARNRLHSCAAVRDWDRSEQWNGIAEELQPSVHLFVKSVLSKVDLSEKEKKRVEDAVSWDVMMICCEDVYKEIVTPCFYIPFVEPHYATGHFPCGWDGDEFPDGWDGIVLGGQLMVF